LVEKHGTDKQAFLLAYELRKILPETEKSITELSMTNKTIQLHFKGNKGIEPSISTLGEKFVRQQKRLFICAMFLNQLDLFKTFLCLAIYILNFHQLVPHYYFILIP
jgi:hypothetical protein